MLRPAQVLLISELLQVHLAGNLGLYCYELLDIH